MKKITAEAGPVEDIGPLIGGFKAQLSLGADAWLAAGKIVARIFEADPSAMPRITREARVPPSVVKKFRDIGRGLLIPQLFAASVKARTLPVAHQRLAASGTLPCVVQTPAGYDIKRVDLLSAGREATDQMIGPHGLRSEAEQIAFLKESGQRKLRAREERIGAPDARWTFDGGCVYITRLGIVTSDMVEAMARDYGISLRG